VPRHGSTYDFYEVPKKEENSLSPDVQDNENSTNDEQVMAAAANDCTTTDREINNSTNNPKNKSINKGNEIRAESRSQPEEKVIILPQGEFVF